MPRQVGTRCPRCTRRRPKGQRCPTCAARRHSASTTERGYGTAHQVLRAAVAVDVAEGRAICWRCHRQIQPGTEWNLGHDDTDRTLYRGPEHAKCNIGATARRWQTP